MALRHDKPWGLVIPPYGTMIDKGHPLGYGCTDAYPLNDATSGSLPLTFSATGNNLARTSGPVPLISSRFGRVYDYNVIGSAQYTQLNYQTIANGVNKQFLNATKGTACIWWKNRDANFNVNQPILTVRAAGLDFFDIYLYLGDMYAGWYTVSADKRVIVSTSTAGITDLNTWYHLTITWNAVSGLSHFYVNGILRGTTTGFAGGHSTAGVPAYIAVVNGFGAISMISACNVRIYDRGLSQQEVQQLYCEPWAGYATPKRKEVQAPPPAGISGSASIATASATLAAPGTVLIQGDNFHAAVGPANPAGITTSPVVLASTATNQIVGAASIITADTTSQGVGDDDLLGLASITTADTTLASSGTVSLSGDAAITTDPTTLVATGTQGNTGTLSQTLEDTACASTGTVDIVGACVIGLDSTICQGVGNYAGLVGLAAITTEEATLSGAGEVLVTGSAGITTEDCSASSDGDVTGAGTGTLTGFATLVAAGTVEDPVYNAAWNPTRQGIQVRRAEDAREEFRYSAYGPLIPDHMKLMFKTAGGQRLTDARLNAAGLAVGGPDALTLLPQGDSLTVGDASETLFLLVMIPASESHALFCFTSSGPTKYFGSADMVDTTPSSGEVGAETTTDHLITNNTGAEVAIWVKPFGI